MDVRAPSGQALSASPTEPVPVSALSGNDPSRWERVIIDALRERKLTLDACPANKRSLGDKECPKCGASSRGPCWEGVRADAIFVDTIKELVA